MNVWARDKFRRFKITIANQVSVVEEQQKPQLTRNNLGVFYGCGIVCYKVDQELWMEKINGEFF